MADEAEKPARSKREQPKFKLNTLRLDGRSVAARRIKAVASALAAALGEDLTPIRRATVERAAALNVLAATIQERFMRQHEGVSANDVIRAVNAADRAVRRLGIKPDAAKPQSRLAEMLRGGDG